ncbi:hypothetical protein CRV09_00135 [Candidatus Pantoea edessiphila]|uniref:Lipoprotein n=1 Tax=Candidatus Pantoea edessiphila TaxID=2044610 RepID=A0A2P5T2B5_9GAMM|nr:hypothetical protein [Candidatus Pantoea edessiphila]PPI88718.1 hypothetical protein CRV09_00135 [Candidatus Pantoea edessiphila]
MKNIFYKLLIILITFTTTGCNFKLPKIFHAPHGFRDVIIYKDKDHSPISPYIYKGLASNHIRIVKDTEQNRANFPVLYFIHPQKQNYPLLEILKQKKLTTKNCKFKLETSVDLKLPKHKIFKIKTYSYHSLCEYIGTIDTKNNEKYNKLIDDVGQQAADKFLNELFYQYSSKVKIKRIVLNPSNHNRGSNYKYYNRKFLSSNNNNRQKRIIPRRLNKRFR